MSYFIYIHEIPFLSFSMLHIKICPLSLAFQRMHGETTVHRHHRISVVQKHFNTA